MTVNGVKRDLQVPPMKRLLDVLREDLGLTGTKEGCGEGECGACAVIMDGLLILSCMVPVCQAQGKHITTIEGLANEGNGAGKGSGDLHPIQASFHENGGAQ